MLFLLNLISNTHQLSTKDTNVCRTRNGLECCFGYVLSQDKCEECPAGYYGNACKKECLEGQYGRLCDYSCNCTRNQVCDKVVGCVLKKDVSTFTVRDAEKMRTSLYDTNVQLSTGTASPTNSSDSTNQSKPLMPSATKQTTEVYYVIYSSSGFLIMFSILLFIAGCIGYKLKSSKNSTVFPSVIDQSIYDDIGETDDTIMISNINRQEKQAKCPYLPPPRDYYSEHNEYDYAACQSDDYLNPYNCIRKSEYSDHVYNGIIK